MTTIAEMRARLTEMSARTQQMADEMGDALDDTQHADNLDALLQEKDAEIERLTRERDAFKDACESNATAALAHRACNSGEAKLIGRAEKAERERDDWHRTADSADNIVRAALGLLGESMGGSLSEAIRELQERAEKVEHELADLRKRVQSIGSHFRFIVGRDGREMADAVDELITQALDRTTDTDVLSIPEKSDTSPERVKQHDTEPEFKPGDRITVATRYAPGMVRAVRLGGYLAVDWEDGSQSDWKPEYVRHVYDVDHEPPKGVTVVKDMGDVPMFLMRAEEHEGNAWRWTNNISSTPRTGYPWKVACQHAHGPLIEWRGGDA